MGAYVHMCIECVCVWSCSNVHPVLFHVGDDTIGQTEDFHGQTDVIRHVVCDVSFFQLLYQVVSYCDAMMQIDHVLRHERFVDKQTVHFFDGVSVSRTRDRKILVW